eukprot:c356_g1_i1.p1 GENE.c356_g1_i1~~c356_g1_i1.p1  ORF type:complete len:112 (-),score=31.39 c356_g1_i1:57-371(-)
MLSTKRVVYGVLSALSNLIIGTRSLSVQIESAAFQLTRGGAITLGSQNQAVIRKKHTRASGLALTFAPTTKSNIYDVRNVIDTPYYVPRSLNTEKMRKCPCSHE